ncbi:hypothetical protein [Draconibacterium sediminis]|uniref:hypothetical protein n=1 Tax=Draconibacterium sediminis TaxID=1544798 RepID=UPI0026EC86E9|nr:hypothetical protein [Draconibacterium sediminis]
MNSKVIIILAFFLFIHSICTGQVLIERLENYRFERIEKNQSKENITEQKELILGGIKELENVFKIIRDKYNTDLISEDTLYIISGYDFVSGHSNGRIWNKIADFRYEHTFDVENYKVKNEKIKVFKVDSEYLTSTQFPILVDFNPLIELIELKDTAKIFSLHSENMAESGWNYSISIIEKGKEKYNIIEFSLSDFWIKDE